MLLGSLALALPWSDGERLVFALYYRGLRVGDFALTARKTGGGWHFRGAPEGPSLAGLLGFDLVLTGESDEALRFLRFEKRLRAPSLGEVALTAWREGAGLVAARWENGRRVALWRYSDPEVKNDLSLLYHLRVRPEGGPITLLGLYGPVRTRMQALGETPVRVPAGHYRALHFLINHPGAYFELYLTKKERWPVRLVLGFGRERLEAQLLHTP